MARRFLNVLNIKLVPKIDMKIKQNLGKIAHCLRVLVNRQSL